MALAAALSILALTVGLSLTRPTIGRIRVEPAIAAVIGGILIVVSGLLPLADASRALAFLSLPVLTIISLMAITLIAERAGFFQILAWRIAAAAHGDARTLFAYLFFAGTMVGTLFTNDAAVLILTPMVYRLIEEVAEESWTTANKIPYYFGVLYVANLVGAFTVSNPINIIVSSWFGIGFVEYAAWMLIPAVASMVVTYYGLRIFFRRVLPVSYRMPEKSHSKAHNKAFLKVSGIVLMLTLSGFFTEHLTGIPTAYVAAISAGLLLILHLLMARGSLTDIVSGIGWDVIIFVAGIFLVVSGLRLAGFTDAIGGLVLKASAGGWHVGTLVTGFIASSCSAIMNNHPVAVTMAMAIRDLPLTDLTARILAFSALIGGDLGPKMLPIGSLAALMWFRILRSRGVEISYWQYIKLGVPVTISAVIVSVLVLNLELFLYFLFQ